MIVTPDPSAANVPSGLSPDPRNFNNPAVVVQSWYVAGRSKAVARGQVRSVDLGTRRIAVYRDAAGRVHALDARCPHLGADLGQGSVAGDRLRCAFHGWQFGLDGRCRAAPGLAELPRRRVRRYPVEERWGLIWIFNGPVPLFALPGPPPNERLWRLRPPPQQIRCHPHLVLANGLDAPHFEALHDMRVSSAPELRVEKPYRITLRLCGKPRSRLLQHLTGSRQRDIAADFMTIGGSLAWLTVLEPVRFYVLFSGRPTADGGCYTQTLLFVPARAPLCLLQAITVMAVVLRDDRRMLDHLDFFPGFTANDAGLTTFARIVDAMETW